MDETAPGTPAPAGEKILKRFDEAFYKTQDPLARRYPNMPLLDLERKLAACIRPL